MSAHETESSACALRSRTMRDLGGRRIKPRDLQVYKPFTSKKEMVSTMDMELMAAILTEPASNLTAGVWVSPGSPDWATQLVAELAVIPEEVELPRPFGPAEPATY